MSKKCVVALSFLLLVNPAIASKFCGDATFVTMDWLVINKNAYLNKRILTRAVLRTDAKEFALIKENENTHYGLRTSYDDESNTYKKWMPISAPPSFNVVDDFYEKLRALEGDEYKPDMTKIRYYRQDVLVCGRVVKSGEGEYSFAVDDMMVKRSYLLPWEKGKSK